MNQRIQLMRSHGRLSWSSAWLTGAVAALLVAGCGGGGGGGGSGGSGAVGGAGGGGSGGAKDAAVGPDLTVNNPDLPVADLPVSPGTGGTISADVAPDRSPDLGAGGVDGGGTGGVGAGGGGSGGAGGSATGGSLDSGLADAADTSLPGTGGMDGGPSIDGGVPACGAPQKAWGFVTSLTNLSWTADNALVTGATFFATTTDFAGKPVTNNGSADILIAKLDATTGTASWVFTAGDSLDQWVTSTASTKVGVGVIGTFKGTLDIDPVAQAVPPIVNPASTPIDYLMALSPTGKAVWSKKVNLGVSGTATGKLNAIASNVNQDLMVVCGAAMNNAANLSATGTPGGGKDVIVAALKASDGSVLWAKLLGGAMDQECDALAMDDAGNVALAGTYAGTLDLGAGALPAGPTLETDGVLWVATLNGATGAVSMAKAFGTTGRVTPYSVAFDAAGNVVVAGSTTAAVAFGTQTLTPVGSADAFVAKLAAGTLAPAWARRWGGAGGSAVNGGIAADSAGNLTVVGSFRPTADTGPGSTVLQVSGTSLETVVASLDGTSGQTLCAHNYGDASSTGGAGKAVAINHGAGALKDRTAVVGNFSKVIDFGGSTKPLSITSVGASASYLVIQ